jgi:3-oxoacyl-[acyl-carrier protein] reductase
MSLAVDTYGALNVMVPCAGIIKDSLLISTDRKTGRVKRKMGLDAWKAVLDVNLTGTFLCVRDAAEAMVNSGSKGILFVISSVNRIGQIGQLNYSSTKAAGDLFPKIIVGEFNRRGIEGIRVVGIAPGYVGTPMVRGMDQNYLNEAILPHVHIGRLVEPEEVADLILYVCGNEAIDATTIEITGGLCHADGIAK